MSISITVPSNNDIKILVEDEVKKQFKDMINKMNHIETRINRLIEEVNILYTKANSIGWFKNE